MAVALPAPPTAPARPAGDPGAPRAWAHGLRRAAALLDDRSEWVATGAVSLIGADAGWSGMAADAYAVGVAPHGRDLETVSITLRTAAAAAEAYADALESAQRRADELDGVYRALTSARADLRSDAAALDAAALGGEAGPGAGLDTSAHAQALTELRRRAADLGRDIALHAAACTWVRRDTEAAEVAFVAVLHRFPSLHAAQAVVAADGGDPALIAALAKAGVGIDGLAGMTPTAVAAWWARLTDAERDALLVECPDVIGHLDGVPAGVRDTANRTLLDRDLHLLTERERRGELTPSERAALANARAVRDQIAVIEATRDDLTGEPLVAQLYDYQPYRFGGDGRALLSVGDLTTADNVAFTVPGMTTTVSGSLAGNVDNALNLYGEARWADSDETMAALVWIGYDAPSDWDVLTVVTEDRARAGGALLAADVAGYQASRGADQPNLTVIGHSYGSTTTAHAATDVGLDVDSIALIGSPGAGSNVDHAADLGIGADDVWVGADPRDPVTWLGSHGVVNTENLPGNVGLGNDPAEDDFGAQRFQAKDPDLHLNPFAYHSGYYQPGTESLYNLAALVTGNEDLVTHADHRTDPWWRGPYDPEASARSDEMSHQ